MKAARASELSPDGDHGEILESLLSKGFQYEWILSELGRQQNARSQFRSAYRRALRRQGRDTGWQPGRTRYKRRVIHADIEIYYYH